MTAAAVLAIWSVCCLLSGRTATVEGFPFPPPGRPGPSPQHVPTRSPVSGEPLALNANLTAGLSYGDVDPVMFNTVLFDTASGYDKDTGLYTAPVTGRYSISVKGVLCVGADSAAWAIRVNDGQAGRRPDVHCLLQIRPPGPVDPCDHDFWLRKGQTLWVEMKSGCVWGLTMYGTSTVDSAKRGDGGRIEILLIIRE